MEPSPLRSQQEGPSTRNLPQMQSLYDSTFLGDDCLLSSIMELPNKSDADDLLSSLGPAVDPTPSTDSAIDSKRSLQDFVSFYNDKRSRPMNAVTADKEESTARFRPYQDKQWRAQFQRLIQYKMKHGHCCVPHSYKEDPMLARWVKRQRYQYKKFKDGNPSSTITTARIQELESIGFVWHSHASAWLEKFNELKAYQQKTGHCNVPSDYPENRALSSWVKCQRRQYKLFSAGSSSMTIDRLQALESLGFVFEPQLVSTRRVGLDIVDAYREVSSIINNNY
ncbi:unnamed protein product [Cylindrotheca closterium]|uniref:Helicase-associated domain-containing protein n=1 Tax=Cylindrotheca closterium TaxID=2856 RepID=A0AAD2CKU2_9STRA|nr:unnamed protein product [Cylindrotheca closterium]